MNSIYKTVYTTGYEGRDIEEFLEYLDAFNIQMVVDIREIPLSRKKGFSKSTLKERLAEHNIDYIHIRSLGSPSYLRKKVYQDKDFESFFEEYEKHLETCHNSLEELYKVVSEKLSCLLCFEREYTNCHRSVVADKVSRINGTALEVKHI